MNTKIFFWVVVLSLFNVVLSQAQNNTIIDHLQTRTSVSEGMIRITSNPAITALLGAPNNQMAVSSDLIERSGYRIRVFMGNSRSEATSRDAAIKSAFPELQTYLNYEAPNWKLSAGDFITREEATVFLQKFQKDFPLYGKEMYILVDKIKVPLY
jgi:hypothetical protein